MLNSILKSDNPLIRYGGSTLIVFGSLYFLSSVGLVPVQAAWLVSVIILIMILMLNIGQRKATFA